MAKHARTKRRTHSTRRFTRESLRRALRGPLGIVLALCVVGAGGYAILSRLLGSGSTNVLDTLRARGTIVVGVQSDRAPYGQMDDSGTASGFEPELATALCESVLGTGSVQFLGVNPKTARAQLEQENCDVLFAMVVVNEVNLSKYQLSDAYAQEPVALLSRGGQSVDLNSADTRIGVIPSSNSDHVSVDQQSERHGGGHLELPGCHRRAFARHHSRLLRRDQRAQPHRLLRAADLSPDRGPPQLRLRRAPGGRRSVPGAATGLDGHAARW